MHPFWRNLALAMALPFGLMAVLIFGLIVHKIVNAPPAAEPAAGASGGSLTSWLAAPISRDDFRQLVGSAKNQQELLEKIGAPDRTFSLRKPMFSGAFRMSGDQDVWVYQNPKVFDPISQHRDRAVWLYFPVGLREGLPIDLQFFP